MPKRRRKKAIQLLPEEVLCAIGEYVRRHKDTSSGPGHFSYHITLEHDGGARIEFSPEPSSEQVVEWEAELRSRREALH